MIARRVLIYGRVQGVSYRAWTIKTARKHEITGWVRNRREGTVEAVFHGTESNITGMIEACKSGPMMARVDKIEQFAWQEPAPETFSELPTV